MNYLIEMYNEVKSFLQDYHDICYPELLDKEHSIHSYYTIYKYFTNFFFNIKIFYEYY